MMTASWSERVRQLRVIAIGLACASTIQIVVATLAPQRSVRREERHDRVLLPVPRKRNNSRKSTAQVPQVVERPQRHESEDEFIQAPEGAAALQPAAAGAEVQPAASASSAVSPDSTSSAQSSSSSESQTGSVIVAEPTTNAQPNGASQEPNPVHQKPKIHQHAKASPKIAAVAESSTKRASHTKNGPVEIASAARVQPIVITTVSNDTSVLAYIVGGSAFLTAVGGLLAGLAAIKK
jgi:hypothetical protein